MHIDPMPGQSASPVEVEDAAGIYRASHDVSEGGLTVTLTRAVAEVAGVDPETVAAGLPEQVDPGALDALFRTPPGVEPCRDRSIDLAVAGYDVTVHGDGTIVVRE